MKHYPPRTPTTAGHWSPGRDRATQAAFRQAMIAQAGGLRCQLCGTTQGEMQAHHDTPTTGRLLCRACHRHVDPHAR
jgi:hypothetical protein